MTARHRVSAGVASFALLVAAAGCGSTANTPIEVSQAGIPTRGTTVGGGDAVVNGTDGQDIAGTTGPGGPTGDGSTGSASATTTPGGSTAAGAVPTGPIEVGFITTAVSNASAFGATLGGNLRERDIVNALVQRINAEGGFAGRTIVPVFSDTDTGSPSWDADFAAACATFTEDHHVEVVLGYVFAQVDAFEACLRDEGIPHLSGTFGTPDAPAQRAYPYLFALASPTIEKRSLLKIDGALDAGLLSAQTRVGIVMDGCSSTTRSWKATVEPYLAAKGIPVATVFEFGCPRGSGDAASDVGRVGNLVLQLRSAKADVVLFHATSEGPAVFVTANAAEPQGYRPTYIVSSLAQTAVLGGQIPPAQRANVHGFGWMAFNDAKPAQWPGLPPAATRCLDLLKAGGIVPSTSVDYAGAFFSCDAVFLYQEAIAATGGRTDGPSIAAAIEAMGTSHASAITIDGGSRFGPGRHEAPVSTRRFGYDASCACFTYRSETRTIP